MVPPAAVVQTGIYLEEALDGLTGGEHRCEREESGEEPASADHPYHLARQRHLVNHHA
jgi:hypothetical protein